MKENNFFVYSFYRFKKINDIREIKLQLDNFFKKKFIKGTVLIAYEGINASLSGNTAELDETIDFVKKKLKIRKLNTKKNKVNSHSFNKLKVRIKKEIVSLGLGSLDINKLAGKYISPAEWDKVISQKNIKLIDTRNRYEIKIGKFKNSINPKLNNFREFPIRFNAMNISKSQKIAMYCTGGIRCEKASAYLKNNGFKNVCQLDGGIINYLEHKKKVKKSSLWKGDCFVFDNRVSINKRLLKGKYYQCYGCRKPITKKHMDSPDYKKGVYCPLCHGVRTKKQIRRSISRQDQIDKKDKKFIKQQN